MPPVQQATLDAQQELAAKKNRVRYSAEVMEATTRTALTYGAREAGLRHKVPEDTVRTWLAFYRKNDKKFPTPQKRGRAPLEPPEREKEIAGIADSLRSRGEKLDARHISAAATGLHMREHGMLQLKVNGGTKVFSRRWATDLLRRQKFNLYRATTDRTIPASEIVKAAEGFRKRNASSMTGPNANGTPTKSQRGGINNVFFSKQKTLLQRDQYYNGFNYNVFSKKMLINPVVNEASTVEVSLKKGCIFYPVSHIK